MLLTILLNLGSLTSSHSSPCWLCSAYPGERPVTLRVTLPEHLPPAPTPPVSLVPLTVTDITSYHCACLNPPLSWVMAAYGSWSESGSLYSLG